MILVTGGNGVIGSRLAAEFRKRSEIVRILALPDSKVDARLAELGVEIVHGDVTQIADLEKACKGISTVYHLAALLSAPENPSMLHRVNTGGTENLLRAAEKNQVGHFIYISSISVNYPRENPYSRSKIEAENLVKHSGMHWTIARPCLVLDGMGGGDEYRTFAKAVRKLRFLCLPRNGANLKRPLHAGDLAEALIAMHENPVTYGKTYALGGLDILSLGEMAKVILKTENLGTISIPLPMLRIVASLSETASRLFSRRLSRLTHQSLDGLIYDAAPDIEEARRDLSWNPRGIKEFLA